MSSDTQFTALGYRVTAKRKDAADVRFAEVQEVELKRLPEPPESSPIDAQ